MEQERSSDEPEVPEPAAQPAAPAGEPEPAGAGAGEQAPETVVAFRAPEPEGTPPLEDAAPDAAVTAEPAVEALAPAAAVGEGDATLDAAEAGFAADEADARAAEPAVAVAAEAPEAAVATAEAAAEPEVTPDSVRETSPNWMLAFVCGWAGLFALYQILEVIQHRPDIVGLNRTFALGGYLALGIGLVGASLEAVLWGRLRSRRALQAGLILLPMALVAAGVACLLLFNDPNPTKGRI